MNLIYYNSSGERCPLARMIREEPEWAEARIREGEKAIERIAELESVDALGKAEKLIVELESALAAVIAERDAERERNRWIPVTERLPDNTGFVDASFDGSAFEGHPLVGYYSSGKWFNDCGDEIPDGYVLAWKPRPQPYNPEAEP